MATLINSLVMCATKDHSTAAYNKSVYVHQYMHWVDIALGIIFCVVGALATHGLIPMSGGQWLIFAGSTALAIGVILPCISCCKVGYHACAQAIAAYRQGSNPSPDPDENLTS